MSADEKKRGGALSSARSGYAMPGAAALEKMALSADETAGAAECETQLRHIEKLVLAFCGRVELFAPFAKDGPPLVFAAVSGGADSMALLRLLCANAAALNIRVAACHVNHGLRGASADRDEAFVRAACKALGVPLHVFHAAEEGMPPPPNAGEDWARRLRYHCFEKLCRNANECVATAHTLTDQTETLLFRLARGTGLHGAAGIPVRRGVFVRPLLCLTRAETERCCDALGQAYVTDETNLSDDYARNRLRHYALPALCAANAAAEQNFGRFCEKAARADAYFSALAEEALTAAQDENAADCWALAPLRQVHPLVREALAHRLISPVRDAEEKYVRLLCALIERGSGAVQLHDEVRFTARDGLLRKETTRAVKGEEARPQLVFEAENAKNSVPLAHGMPLRAGKYTVCGADGLRICFELDFFPEKTQSVHKKDLKNEADYAKIAMLYNTLTIRARQPGDYYRPAGRGVGKSLKKLLNEAAVPPVRRAALPVLAAGNEILWLYGFGFAEGLAPDETTRTVLRILSEKITEDVES